MLVHAVEFGAASAYHPCDFVAIHEEGLVLFLEEGEFLVGEEVAEEFASATHAEGGEGVACSGSAEGEFSMQFVSIEIGKVGVFLDVQVLDGHDLLLNGGHGVALRFHDDVLSIDEDMSAFGHKYFATFGEC